jgi:hypothetical protein
MGSILGAAAYGEVRPEAVVRQMQKTPLVRGSWSATIGQRLNGKVCPERVVCRLLPTANKGIIALSTGFDVIIDEKLSLIRWQCHFSMLRHGGASFKALLSHSAHHRLQLARRGIRLVKAGRLARLVGC